MEYKRCEFRLGEPDDLLLGIAINSGGLEDGTLFKEICFGILIFSIAVVFNVDSFDNTRMI